MDLRNCPSCGKMFSYSGKRVCPECIKKQEEKLVEVKKYLDENPNAPLMQIATDMDVSVKQLQRWVKEERLIIVSNDGEQLVCEKCGRMIATGRFCKECKEALKQNFAGVYAPKQEVRQELKSGSAKMRFAGRNKLDQ